MRIGTLAILCWAGCVSLGFAQQATVLGPEATQAALDEICHASQANFEKIRTWRGSWSRQGPSVYYRPEAALLLDRMGIPADVTEVRGDAVQTIDFAFERASGRLFARAEDVKTRLTDGRTGQKLRAPEHGGMWRGGESLLWTPDQYVCARRVARDKNGRSIHEGRHDRGPGQEEQDLLLSADPRRMFGFGESPAWEYLAVRTRHGRNRGPEEITAAVATQPAQTGYWVEQLRAESPRLYRVVWRGEGLKQFPGTLREELWFDEAAAFNLVRGDTTIGVLRKHFEIAYERQQGVYLPQHMLRECFDADGRLQNREDMTLTASTLNEPLPAEQFSLKSLGLRDGERVIDKVNGGEYRYQAGTLTSQPAAKPAAGPAR